MSFLPLSYSTTSLSTTHSACFTDVSDSTGYTSDCRRDPVHCVKGKLNAGGGEGDCVDPDGQKDEMRKFLLGPGWHDHRVPPAERLKHLYRLLEEHYDRTGGDYHGQSTFHICRIIDNSNRVVQPAFVTCMPYLTSIGAEIDFPEDSNDMSPDPMNDLIDEAFHHPTSLSSIHKDRAAPISTWEIDWSRPPPQVIHAYWEVMHCTRPKPAHEFTRVKPVVVASRVNPRLYCRQEGFPQYYDVEENIHSTSKKFRAVLHKIRGLVTSH
ncbi:hypothetical protein BDM02DRAFT_278900 [Thelephora ganbajun]|uniref:Uncharacterized protein n=1 Tax=Thelephora ganbajun TaxID=370292 RepID=A0ACB6Z9C3_THEGA|nr:hypothetical protein BDM02DRAFT_278900 [Thelephora ganbajun]